MPSTIVQGKKLSTVELNWKEVFYTNCGMVSASNIDQELGWCKTDFAAIGVDYSYLLSRRENDWYPHYIHNLDNLIRFGGLYPPIHVQADIRRTRLLGATPTYEGGCMLVRAKDPIFKMSHLKGKRIGLSKSLNTLKSDWWRITEHYGILNMLMLNDMTIDDVEIVEFPHADDWYADPKMLEPSNQRDRALHGRNADHKRTLITRPLETALLDGKVDAIYTHSKTWQHLQEDTGKIAAIEDLSRYPDWRLQANNEPAIITCSDVMAEAAPRAGRHLHEGDDQGRALGQRAQARRGGDPRPPDLLSRHRGHLPGHQAHRHGAQPVAEEPGPDRDRQGLHAGRLHQ